MTEPLGEGPARYTHGHEEAVLAEPDAARHLRAGPRAAGLHDAPLTTSGWAHVVHGELLACVPT
ncbi:MAG: hypothetical protein ABIP45_08325 [Knoellia sp.]